MKNYYVYIATSHTGILYIGVTNDLGRRMYEHKNSLVPGFTSKYKIKKLIYYEETNDVISAITREKQLKGWRREKKIWLVSKVNPKFKDLIDPSTGSG